MEILSELDEIKKTGIEIFIDYGHYIMFASLGQDSEQDKKLSCKHKEGETFEQTMYQAILDFHETFEN